MFVSRVIALILIIPWLPGVSKKATPRSELESALPAYGCPARIGANKKPRLHGRATLRTPNSN